MPAMLAANACGRWSDILDVILDIAAAMADADNSSAERFRNRIVRDVPIIAGQDLATTDIAEDVPFAFSEGGLPNGFAIAGAGVHDATFSEASRDRPAAKISFVAHPVFSIIRRC